MRRKGKEERGEVQVIIIRGIDRGGVLSRTRL
jgi:hypothetical protein